MGIQICKDCYESDQFCEECKSKVTKYFNESISEGYQEPMLFELDLNEMEAYLLKFDNKITSRQLISGIIIDYLKLIDVGYMDIVVLVDDIYFSEDLLTHETFEIDGDNYYLNTMIGKIEIFFESGMIDPYYMEPRIK